MAPYAKGVGLRMPYLSMAEHEKLCQNLGRPRSKAKYGMATDRGRVP